MTSRKLPGLAFWCVSMATAQVVVAHPNERVSFRASNGQAIELNTSAATLAMPRAKMMKLRDCSDQLQICLTDGHRLAFSYFRNCDDAAPIENYQRLRFRPKIVSVLHGNLWMVFDASPNFMFHYVEPTGLVGIYVGRTASFDFRTLLRKRGFNLSDYDALEYRIVPPGAVAACK